MIPPTKSSAETSADESPQLAASRVEIDQYLDEVWLERGLSENTLSAYRRDLVLLARALPGPLLGASGRDLLDAIAERFEAGYKTRSSARWLSCIKGFYRPFCT